VSHSEEQILGIKDNLNIRSLPSTQPFEKLEAPASLSKNEANMLQEVFMYFKRNPAEITDSPRNFNMDSSIQQIQRLGQQETALVLDYLLENLQNRTELIRNRISSVLSDLGKDSQVIFEGKDFQRETETAAQLNHVKQGVFVEEELSVNSQIETINSQREYDPKRRFYELVTKNYNPVLQENMTKKHMQKSLKSDYQTDKLAHKVSEVDHQSELRKVEVKLINPDFLGKYRQHVEEVKHNMDVSFDQLYQRERQVVQDIVQAEAELEQAKKQMPKFGEETTPGQASSFEHPAEKIRNEMGTQRARRSLGFEVQSEETPEMLLREGRISGKDYEYLQHQKESENLKNLGYGFVTFTHKDEAIMASAMNHQLDQFSTKETPVTIKGSLDHKDFDPRFKAQ